MFSPPKAATLAKFALNHSLPKEKQTKFSKKIPSLQIFIVNYAPAAVTIGEAKIFSELRMKFCFSWLFFPKIKAPSAAIRDIS